MKDQFMGHAYEYWITLQERAEELNATKLIQEIARLHAKVSFYESRIADMERFRAVCNANKSLETEAVPGRR